MNPWLERFAQASFHRSADTAHDLKTPLNVAVLNLELLRMRLGKLANCRDDAKLEAYASAIETELRRMARIFDAFFVLSTPPKDEGQPAGVDVCAICNDSAAAAGFVLRAEGRGLVRSHESRIRLAMQLLFAGASKILRPEGRHAVVVSCDRRFTLTISGRSAAEEFELTRIFKFYYTDPLGNPDLSLAAARIIAETYGGELSGSEQAGLISIEMSLPLGEE
jgi:signal transduction histidine kinase